ncbi:hypothetical protein ES319_D07G201700v1 [Gossypium barbadense]|uniref:Uncharacterized protein n=1 Tax=Gossypium barbadense TaxID=3634 RepID=A0A5J5QTN1_GOSBA|nr:hypothetical protein ES319_D07G201700v1 [Gossypium barbadense]PPD82106.1 hypothetical protein GOBAR_DD20966 [Gossypium barbadense]
MAMVGYLLKHVKDGCFNINTESSSLILGPLVKTLFHLDKGLTCKHTFYLFIVRLYKIEMIKDSLCMIQTMMGNGGLNATIFHPIMNMLTKKMEEVWLVADIMSHPSFAGLDGK